MYCGYICVYSIVKQVLLVLHNPEFQIPAMQSPGSSEISSSRHRSLASVPMSYFDLWYGWQSRGQIIKGESIICVFSPLWGAAEYSSDLNCRVNFKTSNRRYRLLFKSGPVCPQQDSHVSQVQDRQDPWSHSMPVLSRHGLQLSGSPASALPASGTTDISGDRTLVSKEHRLGFGV